MLERRTQMLQSKLALVLSAIAMAALAVGAGPAKADIIFGNFSGTGCSPSGLAGAVTCPNPQTFNNGTDNIVANGFSGAPGVGPTALTIKSTAAFGPSESGLGENATAGPPCSDVDCEIGTPHSVTAVDTTGVITDAVIGSVQAGESFDFFVQTTAGGAFTQLGSTLTNACNTAPGFSVGSAPDTCLWVAPPGGRTGVAVEAVTANETLVDVSTSTPTPEPTSLALLGTGLVGLGLAWRRRRKA